jgi:hypothetical protein
VYIVAIKTPKSIGEQTDTPYDLMITHNNGDNNNNTMKITRKQQQYLLTVHTDSPVLLLPTAVTPLTRLGPYK